METISQKCTVCEHEKPVDQFSILKDRGRSRVCRACRAEYLRRWRADPSARLRSNQRREAIIEKKCAKCGYVKPVADFPVRKNRGTGIEPYCRPCRNEITRRNRVEHPQRTRDYDRKRSCEKRGTTIEVFNAALQKQGGRCAICSKPINRSVHIDHCHRTGKFRGLLCHHCNLGLGMFKDNPELLIAAANYLKASI